MTHEDINRITKLLPGPRRPSNHPKGDISIVRLRGTFLLCFDTTHLGTIPNTLEHGCSTPEIGFKARPRPRRESPHRANP